MNISQTFAVSTPSDREVVLSREFAAPRARVWDAMTKPEYIRRWLLGPPGWEMPVCDMDVRVGGTFRWVWRSEESGQQFGFQGLVLLQCLAARARPGDRADSQLAVTNANQDFR